MLRKSKGAAEVVAVLSGEEGNVLVWTDPDADRNESCSYSILPRHRLLYEEGSLLTGMESQAVNWSPGGILNRLLGA